MIAAYTREIRIRYGVYEKLIEHILSEHGFQISADKSKTMAFRGKQPVRTKVVTDGKIMKEVQHFSCLRCYVTYSEIDLDEK